MRRVLTDREKVERWMDKQIQSVKQCEVHLEDVYFRNLSMSYEKQIHINHIEELAKIVELPITDVQIYKGDGSPWYVHRIITYKDYQFFEAVFGNDD